MKRGANAPGLHPDPPPPQQAGTRPENEWKGVQAYVSRRRLGRPQTLSRLQVKGPIRRLTEAGPGDGPCRRARCASVPRRRRRSLQKLTDEIPSTMPTNDACHL